MAFQRYNGGSPVQESRQSETFWSERATSPIIERVIYLELGTPSCRHMQQIDAAGYASPSSGRVTAKHVQQLDVS